MQRIVDVIFRRERNDPDTPVCPSHEVEMRLRGKQGQPTRFSDQTEEQYTLLYFCPVDKCDQSAERKQVRTQIPVPGEPPERPLFSRPNNRT